MQHLLHGFFIFSFILADGYQQLKRHMRNNKFFTLLQTVSPEIFQHFRRYLKYSVPRSEQFTQFMEVLADLHPNYTPQFIRLELELDRILSIEVNTIGEKIANKRRGNFFFRLYNQLKKFLLINAIEHHPDIQQILWIYVLRKQSIAELYNEALREAIKTTTQSQDWSADRNYLLTKLHHESYYNTLNNKFLAKDHSLKHLLNAQQQLDLFYLKLKTKYAFELENRKYILRDDLVTDTIKKTEINTTDPLLDIYRLLKDQQEDPLNLARYRLIFEKFQQALKNLSPDDQSSIVKYLFNNMAVILRNSYSIDIVRYSFELSKLSVNHDLLNVLGGYTPMNFLNIVETAAALGEIEWLIMFLEEHIIKVPKLQREQVKSVALGNLYFAQKAYKSATDVLSNTKSLDPQVEIRIRMLYCKIFYEIGETEALKSQLHSFAVFLRRSQTFQSQIIKGYLNFIRLLNLITDQTQYSKNYIKYQKLLTTITPLFGRLWLIERLSTPPLKK